VNATKTKTETRENFDGEICETIASEIRDGLKSEVERLCRADAQTKAEEADGEEASRETYGQSPVQKARETYERSRRIANIAMRQYRYAASALARELRAEEDHRKQQTADAERRQARDRSDSAAGRSETA